MSYLFIASVLKQTVASMKADNLSPAQSRYIVDAQ